MSRKSAYRENQVKYPLLVNDWNLIKFDYPATQFFGKSNVFM